MRRNWAILLGLAVVLGWCAGCSKEQETPRTRPGQEVPTFREFTGQQGPFPDRGFFVVQRPEAWAALWRGQAAPEVDFTRESVLVALMGQQPTAGYSITIDEVRATPEAITAYVAERRPATGEVVAQVLTYPYDMRVVPKLTTPVTFVLAGETAVQPTAIQDQFLGQQARATVPVTAVLRDQTTWRDFWVNNITAGTEPPTVDFARAMVVAVLIGQRPTAGYTVTITGVQQEGDRLIVSYRIRRPQPGDIVAQVLTTPYAIAVVPQSALPVVFRDVAPPPAGTAPVTPTEK